MASSSSEKSMANANKNKMRKYRDHDSGRGSKGTNHFGKKLNQQGCHIRPTPGRKDHYGIEMRGQTAECDICCRRSDLFGIGDCMHPICMECGIRLRILGGSDQCPKCRAQIDQMRFIEYTGDWSNTVTKINEAFPHKDAERYKLLFANEYVASCFNSYLAHVCPICKAKGDLRTFETFALLNQHVYMVHQFLYCDICIKHLNLLSHERKVYSQSGLQRHLKKGDPDDNSQKGHPQCLFCEKRFLDDEYRYKHLRRKHFFCQICDADGDSNYFYSEHADLISHYKKKHVVCEEGECKQLGIAFRSELELKLHMSTDHGAGKQKLDLDFHYDRGGGASTSGNSRRTNVHTAQNINRFVPRIRIVPNENPEPQRNNESAFKIVPSMQTQGTDVSLKYANEPGFVVQGSDFPRLGSGLKGDDRKVNKSGKANAKTLANSNAEKSSNSNQQMASTSWFIDDDEAFNSARHLPITNETGNLIEKKPRKLAEKQNQSAKASYASAFQRSSVASLLNPQAPNISAENVFPSLTSSNTTVKNVSANSAWKQNSLHFNEKSQIVECVVPDKYSCDSTSFGSSSRLKKLPKPDIWPEKSQLASNEATKLDEDMEESGEKIKSYAVDNKGKKKRGKKEKAKLQRLLDHDSINKKITGTDGKPGSPLNADSQMQSVTVLDDQSALQQSEISSSKSSEVITRNAFGFLDVISSTFSSLMTAISELSTSDAAKNGRTSTSTEEKEGSKTVYSSAASVGETTSTQIQPLPPPPGIVSVLPPGLLPPPGFGPPPGFETNDSFKIIH